MYKHLYRTKKILTFLGYETLVIKLNRPSVIDFCFTFIIDMF